MNPNRFHQRVAVVNSNGSTVRHIHAQAARSMIAAGSAQPLTTQGRIREVQLSRPASSFAERTGNAEAAAPIGTRFTRWVRLPESAARIIEHHPRSLYTRPDSEDVPPES